MDRPGLQDDPEGGLKTREDGKGSGEPSVPACAPGRVRADLGWDWAFRKEQEEGMQVKAHQGLAVSERAVHAPAGDWTNQPSGARPGVQAGSRWTVAGTTAGGQVARWELSARGQGLPWKREY